MSQYWSVAVNAPLKETLTYEAHTPDFSYQRGQSVIVPLGMRKAQGVIVGPALAPNENLKDKIKSITQVNEARPIIPEPYMSWLEWMAHYYIYGLGAVFENVFPPLDKATNKNKTRKASVIPVVERTEFLTLTTEQEHVFNNISQEKKFSTHLLFGVTGSGKTEVYLRLLQECLREGKAGVVLVPEISLTPQLIHRFVGRFGDQVAVLHSQLTDRERTNQWWDFVEKKKSILVGARSALFCPRDDLGLIIVDEEHEASFKQDEKLKYNARDCAIMLAKNLNCPVVLGSATPSLESWKNALDKKFHLHKMSHRVSDRPLPQIEILDLRKEKELKSEEVPHKTKIPLPFWLSKNLHEKIKLALETKSQVALFLNRRGMAQLILCPSCGHTRQCPNCDINLTLHGHHHLICHYCDYHENFKTKCPDCTEGELENIGLGTELVEHDLQRLFPEARLARADRDEITNRLDLEDLITRMENHEIDILIGTQMIAKGLDFKNLKLVGLLLADVGFNLPDFRATEKSYQLITQMSGRAGRHVATGEAPGQVVVQTFNPDFPALDFAQNKTFESFAEHELRMREVLKYPPHGRLVCFRVLGDTLQSAQQTSRLLARRAEALKEKFSAYQEVEILGPTEAPIAKLRGQFRYQILLKGQSHNVMNQLTRQILGQEDWIPKKTKVIVDVDPLALL